MRGSWRALGLVASLFALMSACVSRPAAIVTPSSGKPSPFTVLQPTSEPSPSASVSQRETIVAIARTSVSSGWVLTSHRMLHTSDGGRSWWAAPLYRAQSSVYQGYDFPASHFFVDGSIAWFLTVGSRVHVSRFVADDDAVRTSSVPYRRPSAVLDASVDFLTPDIGWVSVVYADTVNSPASSSDLFRTGDGGATWSLVSRGIKVFGAIHFVTRSEGWALQGDLLHTVDGGRTWRRVRVGVKFDPSLPGGFDALSMFGRVGVLQARVPTGMMGYPVYAVTRDGGSSWDVRESNGDAPPELTYSNTGPPLSLAAVDAGHWRIANYDRLVKTDDAGLHWLVVKTKLPGGINEGLTFVTPDVGWEFSVEDCGGDNCATRLEATADGGKSWRLVPVPLL